MTDIENDHAIHTAIRDRFNEHIAYMQRVYAKVNRHDKSSMDTESIKIFNHGRTALNEIRGLYARLTTRECVAAAGFMIQEMSMALDELVEPVQNTATT